jgi:hypothetical protein
VSPPNNSTVFILSDLDVLADMKRIIFERTGHAVTAGTKRWRLAGQKHFKSRAAWSSTSYPQPSLYFPFPARVRNEAKERDVSL